MTDSNLQQDIIENGLSVQECHTNDFHQKIQGKPSFWNDSILLPLQEVDYDEDVADMYNELDFSDPDEYFKLDNMGLPYTYSPDYDTREDEMEDLDPAGGYGLSSHI